MSDETGKDPVLSSIRNLVSGEAARDGAPLVLGPEFQVETGPLILRDPVYVPPGARPVPEPAPAAEPIVPEPTTLETTAEEALPEDLVAKIAELEKAVAAMVASSVAEQPEADMTSVFEDVERAATDSLMGHNSSLAARFDPEELEPLIRDVLRRDLEGEMGERITRNLRKLIQREIQVALADKRR